ncbi:MAG: hypothetical protein PUK59_04165 [Actinomycetaceae bacterium]|nr:hypothetical protein [Actinomycetaceae bacterium]MDY5854514.1 hypothetical protein [Arcanobacterium sp.]
MNTASSRIVKKWLSLPLVGLIIALVSLSCPPPALADGALPWDGNESPADYYVLVTAYDGVNIRNCPSVSCPKLDFKDPGETLHVLATIKGLDSDLTWLRTESPQGWIASSEVTPINDPEPKSAQPSAPAPQSTTPKATNPPDPKPSDKKPDSASSDKRKAPTAAGKTPPTSEQPASADNDDAFLPLVIIVVALVILICILSAVLLYLLFMRKKGTQQQGVQQNDAQQTSAQQNPYYYPTYPGSYQ